MKTITKLLFLCVICFPLFSYPQQNFQNTDAEKCLKKARGNYFIENKGQWPEQVRFVAQLNGMMAWITNDGVVYDYYNTYDTKAAASRQISKVDDLINNRRKKGQVVKMTLIEKAAYTNVSTHGKKQAYYNYFIGNNEEKWQSNVALYEEVVFHQVYSGISIRYYFEDGFLRYDYIAEPNADLSQIRIKINGAEGYDIKQNGELNLNTHIGDVTHGKLFAYQHSVYGISKIDCSFKINSDGTVGLSAFNYNPALALVIDPLIYSTFIGNSDNEKASYVAVDADGFAYITGYTESAGFPTITGSYDLSLNGYSDIFVTKISTTGSGLEYSTFIGGNGKDAATYITVDTSGKTYITGYSESTNYPATSLAYETVNKGGADAIVTVLGSTGGFLEYSSYIGGSADEHGNAIAYDSAGNFYLAGFTESTNYPTTAAAYDQSHNGYADAFVSKFDPLYGYVLAYSTFIGGTGFDFATSMAIDKSGNVYLTGNTESSTFPTKFGSYDRTYNGVTDAFVTKLDPSGSNLVYSTFIGGNNFDYGTSITIDNSGNSYITGYTESTGFPVIGGAFDVTHNGYNDGFISILNSSGSAIDFSTLIGSSNDDYAYNISRTNNGKIFISGLTFSASFPVTQGSQDISYNSNGDIFVSGFNSNLSKLQYATFLGGSDEDIGAAIVPDNNGFVYVGGTTSSSNFPATANGFDTSFNSGYDAFVTKLLAINQATFLTVSNITSSQGTLSWQKGDGIKRAVFINRTDSGYAAPLNFVHYNANSAYGLGNQIGSTGWYCVYNDTGTSVNVTGLSNNTSYRFMVVEYIGTPGNEVYNNDFNATNPINFKTEVIAPSLQSSNLSFKNLSDTGFTINCVKGNGFKRLIFVKSGTYSNNSPQNKTTYIADSVFGSGSELSTSGWYCVYNDTGSQVSIRGLLPNSIYQLRVFDYNGNTGREQYNIFTAAGNPSTQTTLYKTPDLQSSLILLTDRKSNNLKIQWTKGNGTKRVVFVKIGNHGIPKLKNFTSYTAQDSFGKGSKVDSFWYCVYNGSDNIIEVKNLATFTPYQFFISEYNGTTGKEQYNFDSVSGNPVSFSTCYNTPTIQSSNIIFSDIRSDRMLIKFTKGNGSKRIVFVSDSDTGSAKPINYTSYTADSNYKSGDRIGTTGWYCVYNDTGNAVTIMSLMPFTSYKVMVCEYNGSLTETQYLTVKAINNPAIQTTDYIKPDKQASNISFTAITPNNIIFDYDQGNGSSRLILITEGTTPYPPLVDNTTYFVSSQIGTSGWYCKYNGPTKLTYLSGLHPANWKIMICEYNGSAGSEKYNTDTATGNPKAFTNVGINDLWAKKIQIFPNPAIGQITIENARGIKIRLFNMLGAEILNYDISEENCKIDLNSFADGMYLLKFEKGEAYFYQKVILKKQP